METKMVLCKKCKHLYGVIRMEGETEWIGECINCPEEEE